MISFWFVCCFFVCVGLLVTTAKLLLNKFWFHSVFWSFIIIVFFFFFFPDNICANSGNIRLYPSVWSSYVWKCCASETRNSLMICVSENYYDYIHYSGMLCWLCFWWRLWLMSVWSFAFLNYMFSLFPFITIINAYWFYKVYVLFVVVRLLACSFHLWWSVVATSEVPNVGAYANLAYLGPVFLAETDVIQVRFTCEDKTITNMLVSMTGPHKN